MSKPDPARHEPCSVLVVDDESSVRHVLGSWLTRNGCEVRTAESTEQALEILSEWTPAVAMLDIVLPGRSGLELLSELKQRIPETEVLMMTGHGSVDSAIEAMRYGAYDYLQKPFNGLQEVWQTVLRGFEKRHLSLELHRLVESREDCTEQIVATLDELLARHGGDGRPRGAGS